MGAESGSQLNAYCRVRPPLSGVTSGPQICRGVQGCVRTGRKRRCLGRESGGKASKWAATTLHPTPSRCSMRSALRRQPRPAITAHDRAPRRCLARCISPPSVALEIWAPRLWVSVNRRCRVGWLAAARSAGAPLRHCRWLFFTCPEACRRARHSIALGYLAMKAVLLLALLGLSAVAVRGAGEPGGPSFAESGARPGADRRRLKRCRRYGRPRAPRTGIRSPEHAPHHAPPSLRPTPPPNSSRSRVPDGQGGAKRLGDDHRQQVRHPAL